MTLLQPFTQPVQHVDVFRPTPVVSQVAKPSVSSDVTVEHEEYEPTAQTVAASFPYPEELRVASKRTNHLETSRNTLMLVIISVNWKESPSMTLS